MLDPHFFQENECAWREQPNHVERLAGSSTSKDRFFQWTKTALYCRTEHLLTGHVQRETGWTSLLVSIGSGARSWPPGRLTLHLWPGHTILHSLRHWSEAPVRTHEQHTLIGDTSLESSSKAFHVAFDARSQISVGRSWRRYLYWVKGIGAESCHNYKFINNIFSNVRLWRR